MKKVFYWSVFILAITSKMVPDFSGNSHTPPVSFAIAFFALPAGLVWLLVDYRKRRPLRDLYWGLVANGIILAVDICSGLG